MSPESDGMDEALEGATRVALTAAGRLGEQMARELERQSRVAQAEHDRTARELAARLNAERQAALATLGPVNTDQWWAGANPQDVVRAYTTARAWSERDPEAAAAEERIVSEVRSRYGEETAEAMQHGSEAPQPVAESEPVFEAYDAWNDEAVDVDKVGALRIVDSMDPEIPREQFGQAEQLREWLGRDADVDAAIADKYPDLLTQEQRAAVEERRRAEQERTEAALLMMQADQIDRDAEDTLQLDLRDSQGDPVREERAKELFTESTKDGNEVRQESGVEYDSSERREELAASFEGIDNKAAVDARMTSDVAQGRPARDAVAQPSGQTAVARKSPQSVQSRQVQKPARGR